MSSLILSFSVSLHKCWASSKESATTAGTGAADTYVDLANSIEVNDMYSTADSAADNYVSPKI